MKSIHKSTIKRHIKNQHEGSSSVQCTVETCGRLFKNETSMKDHLRQRHGVFQSLSFWCLHEWRIQWPTQDLLISETKYQINELMQGFCAHMISSDANKLQCSVCFKFIHKNTISRHMKDQHSGAPPAQCDHCSKICKNQSSLKEHMRASHKIYQSFCWRIHA